MRRRRFLQSSALLCAAWPLGACESVSQPDGKSQKARPPPVTPLIWEPARTVVFAAGLLRWAREDLYEPMSRQERRDRALIETLARRGVPEASISFLCDEEATLAAARSHLRAAIAAASEADTFLFYWAGHGDRSESGTSFAVPFDAGDDSDASCLSYDEVVRTIETEGRMRSALLFADTCYSGALADAVTARSGGPMRAGFGASSASSTSTGAWTFTDAIIAALEGAPNVDRDRNRIITLGDFSGFVEDEMAFADGQLANVRQTSELLLGMELGAARPAPCPRYGERIEVLYEDRWWPATITAQPGAQLGVHYDGWTQTWDATVDPAQTRPYAPITYPAGTRVSVESEAQWLPATVLDARLGVHLIHYDDYADTWDEWVSIDRIRRSE